MTAITRTLIATPDRVTTTAKLFGYAFPQLFEPFVYIVAREMAPAYQGGYWNFYMLGSGGFYMAPDIEDRFEVSCATNFFDGELSADALGSTMRNYAARWSAMGVVAPGRAVWEELMVAAVEEAEPEV